MKSLLFMGKNVKVEGCPKIVKYSLSSTLLSLLGKV